MTTKTFTMTMDHAEDPKKALTESVGDISGLEIYNNQLLVAVYVRPNKTKSGIYLSDKTRDEDLYQGKVGLILKKGSQAFVDDGGQWFTDSQLEVGDWVLFRPSDGWPIDVNGVRCRMLDDISVRGKLSRPDLVW